jgi:putative transposase
MTATLDDVAKKKAAEQTAEQQATVELVRLAKERGLSLTGPDRLLKQPTKTVIETSLNEEMTEHPGFCTTRSSWSRSAQLQSSRPSGVSPR